MMAWKKTATNILSLNYQTEKPDEQKSKGKGEGEGGGKCVE